MNTKSIIRASRNLTRSSRLFSTSVRTMAEGDTGSGASRSGGMGQGDAFTKREKANEDQYMRNQELMKAKLREAKKNVDDMEKQMEDMDRQQKEKK